MHDLLIDNCHLPLSDFDAERWTVAITDGKIAGIVPTSAHSGLSGSSTLDAAGRSLLPAFSDAHIHVPESGVEMLRCDMTGCVSRADVIDTIAAYSKRTDKDWIVGRGWSLPFFAEVPATLAELDAVTGGRPAYLSNRDGHSAWANSAALVLAGVTETTPDPDGGRIERDGSSRLTGLLHESAMQLVSDLIPPLSREDLHEGLLAAQTKLFSLGVTAWQDAIVGPFVPTTDVFDLYRDAEESGALRARVTGALWWPRDFTAESLDTLIELRSSLRPDGRFRTSAIKIMYDGVCATMTASLSEPYVQGAPQNGLSFFDRDDLAPHVVAMDAAGFDLHFHVIGDRAVSDALHLLEGAIAANPPRDRRHQLAHVWLLDDESIERMARVHAIANIQPFWAQRDEQMVELTLPVLSERLQGLQFRFRSLLDSGIELAMGSDWPVSSPNPMDGVHVAVNRAHPGDVGTGPLDPAQAISLRSALHAATAGSARALRREDELGRIEVGRAADLVLMDANLSETDAAQLYSVSPSHTFVDGDIVFEAP